MAGHAVWIMVTLAAVIGAFTLCESKKIFIAAGLLAFGATGCTTQILVLWLNWGR